MSDDRTHYGTSTCLRCDVDYNVVDGHICHGPEPRNIAPIPPRLKQSTLTRVGFKRFRGDAPPASVDTTDLDAIIEALPDPNEVGPVEYAAIHDILADTMWDTETPLIDQMIESMTALIVHARDMQHKLKMLASGEVPH